MLDSCRAYAIARTAAQNRSLVHLAEAVGFGFVGTILGERRVAIEAARSDIVFFLMHFGVPDSHMHAIIKQIRSARVDAIRFAPIMLVIGDCPFETVLKYVRFGYDDVIVLPEKRDNLMGRFLNQLNADHTYFQTDTYLGPDRRRMEYGISHDERRTGTTPYMRLNVHRSIEAGIRVQRHQVFGKGVRTAALRSVG